MLLFICPSPLDTTGSPRHQQPAVQCSTVQCAAGLPGPQCGTGRGRPAGRRRAGTETILSYSHLFKHHQNKNTEVCCLGRIKSVYKVFVEGLRCRTESHRMWWRRRERWGTSGWCWSRRRSGRQTRSRRRSRSGSRRRIERPSCPVRRWRCSEGWGSRPPASIQLSVSPRTRAQHPPGYFYSCDVGMSGRGHMDRGTTGRLAGHTAL